MTVFAELFKVADRDWYRHFGNVPSLTGDTESNHVVVAFQPTFSVKPLITFKISPFYQLPSS